MNVLHAISSLDPSAGGPPLVALHLAAAEAASGCRTRIFSYQAPTAGDDANGSVLRRAAALQVDLQLMAAPGACERVLALGARRQCAQWLRQANLLHLHGVWDPMLLRVARAAAAMGVAYCVTPHGMLDAWQLQQKRLKKRLALSLGYRQMLDRAAFLHFLNPDEARLAAPLGLSSPAQVIPNGVSPEELEPMPARGCFRARYPELADCPVVLFLGRLHYKKGLDYLADAFAIVLAAQPRARLVVAGPDGGARAPFEAQLRRLGIAGQVLLVGPLYAEQKLQALVDCDCFCLPSRQEGFSLAIAEALGCGVPVVISEPCHFPEVGEAGAGIVTPLDPKLIAAALTLILSDRAAAAGMGAKGRQLVTARYTWPIVARRMVAAYRSAIGGAQ
jgi:glycosyltransferase involved in cell wall biosynthesis